VKHALGRRSRTVLGVGLLASLATSGGAGPLCDLLQKRQADVTAIVSLARELPPPEKRRLEEALAGPIDFTEMARPALGAEWERRSPAERAEYVSAYESLIRASLVRRVDIYRIDSVEYAPEQVAGDRGRVDTVVHSKDATTEVRWEFVRKPEGWRIADYAIDGLSTVRNYRTQFARILARSGWPGLLDRIRARAGAIRKES
jgi:phospholipid transport system substrate-binding protein